MSVTIRLLRKGNKNNPYFHIVAAQRQGKRDGRYLEKLGVYDPTQKTDATKTVLDADRYQYWLSVGALPSETVGQLVKRLPVANA